MLCE